MVTAVSSHTCKSRDTSIPGCIRATVCDVCEVLCGGEQLTGRYKAAVR